MQHGGSTFGLKILRKDQEIVPIRIGSGENDQTFQLGFRSRAAHQLRDRHTPRADLFSPVDGQNSVLRDLETLANSPLPQIENDP